ncbi:PleD family two-component response regulator [Tahibacter aquaticus]|uniref:PleD family two-component response regulator n=1 Tax=Tahibacter aquaticus TaxID=520092 RepID=A0A4R6YS21_9GAMM|nr:response regulator [Tahibacter aquaticus]TDR40768.1 PleD family two-component response regulator [Tahibacter aquaticus]
MAATTSVAEANQVPAGERALRQRLDTFVGGWRENLGGGWDGAKASLLHEELEKINAEADAQDLGEIAALTLELIVFLCSFVENGVIPSSAQRQALAGMVDNLGRPATTAAERPAPRAAKRAAASHARGLVHYLSSAARSIEALAPTLGAQRFLVRPFEDIAPLILAMSESAPDVLVIDDAFVPQLHGVLEAFARARDRSDPPVCLVLSEGGDLARVLYAQRAGADAVVSTRDAVAILARIEEMLEQRRSLGYRVLVVEDDPAQAKFCESVLHHRGIVTEVCANAAGVIESLHAFHPDLVLLDFYLPDGNGIEVAQTIRTEPGCAFLPVVFLSGEQDLDRRFDAISMGGDDFLTKPVKPRHLLMTVESRVRRARTLSASEGSARGERRGTLSGRDVFLQELQNLAEAGSEACAALVFIGVDEIESVRERIGFVTAGTLGQQLASAIAAELPFARPLCAYGEYAFLALAQRHDELALREALEQARQRLAARTWLSADDPLRLGFSLAAQRISGPAERAESLIRRVRQQALQVQGNGGNGIALDLRDPNVASEDPRVRLVRAILRTPADPSNSVLEYQPLVALAGNLGHQYLARMQLKPPRSSHGILISADEYLPLARDLGLASQVDKRIVRLALRQLHAHQEELGELRLFLPLTAESLLDPAFAPWLATELRTQGVPAAAVALEFSIADLCEQLPGDAAIEALQRVGARFCLRADDESERAQRWLTHAAFSVVRFERPAGGSDKHSPWAGVASRFATVRALGKIVIATGVADMGDFSELLRSGAHYANGAVVCDWLRDFEFDFAGAEM